MCTAVFWHSKRHALRVGDTHEAELIAMSSDANEGTWAKQLLLDIGLVAVEPTMRIMSCICVRLFGLTLLA